jgi:hypothetical protein
MRFIVPNFEFVHVESSNLNEVQHILKAVRLGIWTARGRDNKGTRTPEVCFFEGNASVFDVLKLSTL